MSQRVLIAGLFVCALALALALSSGCGVKGAQLHAEVLRGTHGALNEWGEFIEESCPGLIEAAPNEERATELHQRCRIAGTGQHLAVDTWNVWANLTLQSLEDKEFDLPRALQLAGRLVELWRAAHTALPELPAVPRLLLKLIGADEEDSE